MSASILSVAELEGFLRGLTNQIIEAAGRGALVLTANKRLARHLRHAFDLRKQDEGCTVWPTPQIVSYEAWLHRCLVEAGEGWRLLSASAAQRLWEELIEQSSSGSELELLQVPATARKAHEAHRLLGAYRCRLEDAGLTEDQRVFRKWQERFRQVCRDKEWIDRAELPWRVLDILAASKQAVPAEVLLIGFDQWSPEFDALADLFGKKGSTFHELLPQPQSQSAKRVRRVACVDAAHEIEMAARWARSLLEEGAESIGIVVLDLHARRSLIERIFRDHIDPEAALSPGDEGGVFSLSLGQPLAAQGPVHAALELLRLDHRPTLDQVSFLLRSPYLAASQYESDRRACFDRKLRSARQQSLSRRQLTRMAGKAAPEFASVLEKLDCGKSSRCLPGEWAWRFDRLLRDAGWPGERPLSSREFQVVKAWREKLLPAMASLDPVSTPMTRGAALTLLRRLAGETEFQIEAETGPVQVVGLLESAGLSFDHLCVLGMNEDAFPATARPNPFIPLPLQIEKQMPHASAARELSFARRVLDRLLAASPDVVFSYAARRGDCELRPSPLLGYLAEAEPPDATSHDPLGQITARRPDLAVIDDRQGPPLSGRRAEGGTGILKDQSLCPFRAYAHHRLKCRALESPQAGLDHQTRGSLLHKALEYVWNELQSLDRLAALDDSDLDGFVARHVNDAVEDYFANRPSPAERLLELERHRLCLLIGEWLGEVELQRPMFRVEQIEQEHLERIGPLEIRTVVDRIDRLQDGSRVILDYKTGQQVGSDKLIGERLLEPQLPIYAAGSTAQGVDGVAFACVRRGNCRMVGIARSGDLLPKVAGVSENKLAQALDIEDWRQLIEHWRGQLEVLSAGFAAGEAAVDPVSTEDACRFCDLGGFCRIAERSCEKKSDEVRDE